MPSENKKSSFTPSTRSSICAICACLVEDPCVVDAQPQGSLIEGPLALKQKIDIRFCDNFHAMIGRGVTECGGLIQHPPTQVDSGADMCMHLSDPVIISKKRLNELVPELVY